MVSVNRLIQLTATLVVAQTVKAIASCPTTETIYTGTGGVRYAICTGTDLTGNSARVTNNVASAQACAQLCDAEATCLRAVYDTTGRVCHFKANTGLNWVENARFTVVRVENQVIARCPFTETTQTASGRTFRICTGTDIEGANLSQTQNVASIAACTTQCAANAACVKAVYDNLGRVCHLKALDSAATLIWKRNKQFTVIQLQTDGVAARATQGEWTDLIRLPVIPVAAYVVPQTPESERLLFFSAWGSNRFGGDPGFTQFADYNYKTGTVSQRQVSNTQHDMFCPGISGLEDGRLIITGGSSAAVTSLYDPATNNFVRGPDMKIARGYQTSATLSDGRVFTVGGSYSGPRGGKVGEIYDPVANTWTLLPGADVQPILTVDHEGIWRQDNHAWLYSWSNNSVFQAGPSRNQHWYGTTGTGSIQQAGTRDTGDAMCGTNVMYDTGKILSAGGAQYYDQAAGLRNAHITTIGTPFTPSIVERVPDMAYPRAFGNSVVLPDGSVLVTGGQRFARVFTDTEGVLYPELFNPATKTWRTLALEAAPRNYHAVSILLPDGRVFSGGGGLCWVGNLNGYQGNCNRAVDHPDGQIFSPPYLFNSNGSPATRPAISNVTPAVVDVGQTLTVTASGTGLTFSLVRIGSVTHSINSDQRRISLRDVTVSGSTYTIRLSGDSGVLITGHWYLFAVNSAGVPSVARTVRITI